MAIKFDLEFNPKMQLGEIKNAISQMEGSLNKIKLPASLTQGLKGTFTNLKNEVANFEKLTSKNLTSMSDVSKVQKSFDTIAGLYKKISEEESRIKGLKADDILDKGLLGTISSLSDKYSKLNQNLINNNSKLEQNTKKYNEQKEEIDRLQRSVTAYRGSLTKANNSGDKEKIAEVTEKLDKQEAALEKARTAFQKTATEQERLNNLANNNIQSIDNLRQLLANFAQVDIKEIPQDMAQLGEYIRGLSTEKLEAILSNLNQLTVTTEQTSNNFKILGNSVNQAASKASNLSSMTAQIDQLTNRMTYFFSLTNAWNVFRRVVRQAKDTVKELDDAMTEIAVVSKYTVNDIWAMRKSFSDSATEMGAKTLDLINATKLYVQQGLSLAAAQGVANETIKMARIANLDGAEATNLMTAALRGFNMEMSQANEVTDTYSNLAAKSAADTREIATAMSKTASIANSAGASFENTAAFLTQIIETTREAAETAGTALKTVIARFAELKKAPSEIGEVDGEVVDANKIETALRTAGIQARNAQGEFRDFDDIIIELSGKWDSLDKMTQRYIATMAAGSRQQSRFIALLSNNARLTELLGYANNAAGASQEQFNKTLDSLEAKMNKLSNAWDIFVTNLANNEGIKFAVDALTTIVNILNSFTEGLNNLTGPLGAIGGLISTVITAAMLTAGFIAGGALVKGLKNKLSTALPPEGENAGQWFLGKFRIFLGKQVPNVGTEIGKNLVKYIGKAAQTNIGAFNGLITAIKNSAITDRDAQIIGTNFGQSLMNNLSKTVKNDSEGVRLALELINDEIKKVMTTSNAGNLESNLINLQEEVLKLAEDLGLTKAEVEALFAEAAKKTGDTISPLQKGFNTAGAACTAFGGALTMVGGLLSQTGEEGQKVGQVISIVGTIFMTLGMILPLVGKAVNWFANNVSKAGIKITIAGTTSQLAWWWVFAIIAVIAVLVVGIVALVNSLNSATKKAEEAQAAAEKAGENAANASKKLDELLSARDSYNELQEQLDGLVKGTQEYDEALYKANQQVIELIRNNKDLQYSTDENGRLTITNWDEVIKKQQQVVAQTRSAEILADQAAKKAQIDLQKDNLQKDFIFSSGSNPVIMADTLDRIEKFQNMSIDQKADQLAQLEQEGKTNTSEYRQLKQAYSIDQETAAYEKQRTATYRTNALANMSTEARKTGYANQIADLEANFMKQAENEAENWEQEYYEAMMGGANTSKTDSRAAKLFKEYGITSTDRKQALTELYAKMTGQTIKEVKDSEISEKDMARQVANMDKANLATKIGNKIEQEVSGAKDKTAQQIMLAGSASGAGALSKDVANSLAGIKDIDDLNNILETHQIDKDALYRMYGLNPDTDENELFDKIKKAGEISSDQWDDLAEDFSDIGLNEQIISMLENQHLDLALTQALGSQMAKFSEDGQQEISKNITELTANLTDSQKDTFLREFSNLDLSDSNSIREFSDIMQALGIDIPIDKLDQFEETLVNLGGAFHHMTTEEMVPFVQNISKLTKSLKDGSHEAALSAEEYQQVIETNKNMANEFVMNLDGQYVYIGGKMDTLAEKLQDNTDALLGKNIERLRSEEQVKEKASDYMENKYLEASFWFNGDDLTSSSERIKGNQVDNFSDTQAVQQFIQAIDYSFADSDPEQVEKQRAMFLEYFGRDLTGLIDNPTDLQDTVASLHNVDPAKWQNILEKIGNFFQSDTTGALASAEEESHLLQLQSMDTDKLGTMYEEETDPTERDNIIKALQAQLAGVEGLEEEYDALQRAETNEQKAAAVAAIVKQKNIKDLQKGYKDLKSNVDEYNKAETDLEKSEALTKIRKSLKDMFGVGFTEKWVKENGDKLKTLTEGTKEEAYAVYEEIKNKISSSSLLADQLKEDIKDGEVDINKFQEYVENLPIMAELGLDTTDFVNNLQTAFEIMVKTGKMKADELETYMSALNGLGGELVIDQWAYVDNDGILYLDKPNPGDLRGTGKTVKKVPYKYHLKATETKSNDKSDVFGGGGGSTGSGGSSKEDTPWKQSYDWLYNLTQRTNKELRVRNKLEKEYDDLVSKRYDNSANVLANLKAQEASLKKQKQYYEEQFSGRQKELADLQAEYADVAQYVYFADGMAQINYDAIKSVSGTSGNSDLGKRIDEAFSKFEDIQKKIEGAEDALMDIEDTVKALEERGKDQYKSLEDRVVEAIKQQRQDEINKLKEINDSVKDANQAVVDKLKEGLQEYRDERKAEKDKEELDNLEQQLALMMSDTSGARALDILKAQKELQEKQQSYTDNLIDKKIGELSKQNEEAAKQREEQIKLMTAQLDYDIRSGAIADQANEALTQLVVTGDGNPIIDTLKKTEQFNGMAAQAQDTWIATIWAAINEGSAYWENSHGVEDVIKNDENVSAGQGINFTDKNGNYVYGTLNADGTVTSTNGSIYGGVFRGADNKWYQSQKGSYQAGYTPPATPSTATSSGSSSSDYFNAASYNGTSIVDALKTAIYGSQGNWPSNKGLYTGLGFSSQTAMLNAIASANGMSGGWLLNVYEMLQLIKSGNLKKPNAYLNGGLVDSTGLAWLDGTKSRPEMVLNAKDTQNFIQLRDILQDLLNPNEGVHRGDNYFNITIDVDELANDYDVEQLVEKIKKVIEDDAAYRNVTAVDLNWR